MYDFLEIILSVVVFLSPHDVIAIQMWPYAADTNSVKRELTTTYRKGTNGWCVYGNCIVVTDGKLLDEHGKVLLDIKDNLKVANQTNYLLFPKDWNNPLRFSWQEERNERTLSIYDGTNVIRQIRVKLWKTDPPVEFAFCGPKHTNDLVVLRKKLLAENVPCREIESAPMSVSFGFFVDPKDFNRARAAAIEIIREDLLTVNLELDTNSDRDEHWENGERVVKKHF